MSALTALLSYLAAAILIVAGYFTLPALLFYAGLRTAHNDQDESE